MVTDEGSVTEIAQYGPYHLPLNVFTIQIYPMNQTFIFYFLGINQYPGELMCFAQGQNMMPSVGIKPSTSLL